MTNSIASAKCPTVLTSGNYGMSQNRYTDETKEYFFVKLTDSAYRSLEEYQRNAAKRSSGDGANGPNGAKIQFIGNTGIIHFPPTCDDGGNTEGRKFGFSIDDVEGSLECIQQTQTNLDVLGALSYRMRIHANDDIYDTTRTKMAIAEETEKSKCIREIKTNQTDMWRKGKKPPSAVSSHHHHATGGASLSSVTSGATTGGTGTSSYHHQNNHNSSNNNNNNITNNYNNNNNNHNNGNSSSNSSSFLSNSSNRNSKLVSLSNSPPFGGAAAASIGSAKLSNNSTTPIMTSLSRSPNPTMLGTSGTTCGGTGPNNINSRYGQSLPSHTSASSLSSTLASGISNGYASTGSLMHQEPPSSASAPAASKAPISGTKLGNFRGGSNGGSANGKSGGTIGTKEGSLNPSGCASGGASGNGKLPDIARRKIRERLIHLLALRPFKKPELYNRLQNEGLRERERPLISNFLKDISTLSRDNTYNLKRQMWNYVNENWPYYSEQELQQLKRRKPQNLTPPLSSDAGSSTSGQSPTSTHTGSPPPLAGGTSASSSVGAGNNNGAGVTSGGVGVGNLKRSSLESERFDDSTFTGFQPKKQRISHFKKDPMAPSVSACANTTTSNRNGHYGSSVNSTSSQMVNLQHPNRNSSTSTSSYSPHRLAAATAYTDDGGGSDLSYNVLDNVDDLMSHMTEQTSSNSASYGKSRGSKPQSNVAKGSMSTTTTKRNSGITVNTTLTSGGFCPSERLSGKELLKKSSSAGVSPKSTYGGSFVPESKVSTGRNGTIYPRQSPNTTTQRPNTKTSPHEEAPPRNNNSRYRSANKSNNRTSTPPVHIPSPQQQQNYQQTHNQQQQKQEQSQPQLLPVPPPPPQINSNIQTPQSQQIQPPQHSSPTSQQIAAAYASATNTGGVATTPRCYDFSNYTPITTIEQRRQYKTEFESDYDEYRKLLEQIDSVGSRFRSLAERLDNAREGCPDYYQIKQQIVSEYERISKEESLKRDKQRFDYLHEKLAYIKELVTDYDRKLTAAAAAASSVTTTLSSPSTLVMQQQLHTQQQVQAQHNQQQPNPFASDGYGGVSGNILVTPRNATRLSPMVSAGEMNNSPPTIMQQQHPQQQQEQYYQQHNKQPKNFQQLHNQDQDSIVMSDNNAQISSIKHHQQPQLRMIIPSTHHQGGLRPSNDTESDDSSDTNSNDSNDDDSNEEDDEGDVESNHDNYFNEHHVNTNCQTQNVNKKHKNKKHLKIFQQ